MSHDVISYLVHHIFLPPQLPHKDDSKSALERELVSTTLEGLSRFRGYVSNQQHGLIDSAIAVMSNMYKVHGTSGHLVAVSDEELGQVLANVCEKGMSRRPPFSSLYH